MKREIRSLICFIGSLSTDNHFSKNSDTGSGLILFAIPAYGIQFRCRVEGDPLDLEFGAFFSLLRYLTRELKDEDIRCVRVLSSNAEFVFSFTGQSQALAEGSKHRQLLMEYSQKLEISIGLVQIRKNQAFLSPVDLPALPKGRPSPISPESDKPSKPQFRPIQRGLKL